MGFSESTIRRALRDTVSAQKTLFFTWVGDAMLAVAGGAWLAAIAPETASIAEQVGRVVGGGLIWTGYGSCPDFYGQSYTCSGCCCMNPKQAISRTLQFDK
jgi:hypothetical protein